MAQSTPTPTAAPASGPAQAAVKPSPAIYTVSGSLVNNVPAAKVPALVQALLAAVPSDLKPDATRVPSINVAWIPGNPGFLAVTTNLGGEMTQADIAAVVSATVGAEPANAVLQNGSLGFNIEPAAPAP